MTANNALNFGLTLVLTGLVGTASSAPPEGWHKAGSEPAKYDAGLDATVTLDGGSSAYLHSNENNIDGFGTVMQSIAADDYRGQRVRLSGWMKSENVTGWAGFWMRVDGTRQSQTLAFDNMQDRPIEGTTDWKRYEIVLDVADDAMAVAFGYLLHGDGRVWADDLAMEVVPDHVPLTDQRVRPGRQPSNLDFEAL